MIKLSCLLILFSIGAPGYAQPVADGLINQRLQLDLSINADGSYDQTILRRAVIADAATVNRWTSTRFILPASVNKVSVSDVALIKKSGLRIAGAARTVDIPGAGGTAREITVKLPNPELGDVLEYRLTQKSLAIAGRLSADHSFSRNVYLGAGEMRVHIPRGVDVNMASTGFTSESWSNTSAGRTYSVRFSNPQPLALRAGAADVVASSPRLLLSTTPSYEVLGTTLGAEFRRLGAPGAQVKQLAASITRNTASREEAIRALYGWVKSNIRFTDQNLYVDGITPRAPDQTLASRSGDCKDISLLLSALLTVAGVEHAIGLINTANEYSLPSVAVVQAFNHALVYVPSHQKYLDATDPYSSFDLAPSYVHGKPVLLLDHRPRVHRVARMQTTNEVVTNTVLQVSENGAVKGRSTVVASGAIVNDMRRMQEVLSKGAPQQLSNALQNQGIDQPVGHFNFSYDEKSGAHTSVLQFSGTGIAGPRERKQFKPTTYFKHAHALSTFVQSHQDPRPGTSFVCQPRKLDDTLQLVVASRGFNATLPAAVEIRRGTLFYRATYQRQQNVITVRRIFEDRQQSFLCSAASYTDYYAMARDIEKDLAAMIIFEQKPQSL